MDLNLVHLIFSLTIDGTVTDRFALFRLRRFFPVELRRATCGRTIPCGECQDAAGCPWFPLFGQPLSSDPATVKRHQKPPLPFVFDIPLLTPGRADAVDVEIGLTLVGSAVPCADRFIVAVTRMLEGEFGGSDLAVSLDSVASGTLSWRPGAGEAVEGGGCLGNLRILSAQDVAGRNDGERGDCQSPAADPSQAVPRRKAPAKARWFRLPEGAHPPRVVTGRHVWRIGDGG